jgi:hypothetical protein
MKPQNKSDADDHVPECDTIRNGISIVVESDMIVEIVPDKLAEQIAADQAKLAEDLAKQDEEFPKS